VLNDDLIAEVPRRCGAGVGDQGLVRVEFECEFIAQEPRQLIFDDLGLSLRSDEPQKMIIGVPGVSEPTVSGVLRVTRGELAELVSQCTNRITVPTFTRPPHP
jgi:hypothetical protein